MSVNKWQIYCATEQKWVSGWLHSDDPSPVVCFNNDQHQINIDSCQITETTQIIKVVVEQESIPTGGHYACQGYVIEIPANTTVTRSISWPFSITTSVVNIMENSDNLGDTLEAIVNPKTLVGGVTSVVLQGTKSCTVNSTVLTYAEIGFDCYIGDEHCGRILSINKQNFIIIFEKELLNEKNMGSPFFIELKIIRDYPLGSGARNGLGSGNIGGKHLPKNTVTNVVYKNNSNIDKRFMFNVEYLF
jgi:hypothetical protein